MCVTSLTTCLQYHLVAKLPFRFCMVIPEISASCSLTPSTSLSFMLGTHDQQFPSESEERAGFWVGFVEHCGDSLTHMVLDADSLKLSTEVVSGLELPRIPTEGLLMLDGRMIISLIPNLSNPQPHPQMVTNKHNQMSQLFSSNQGMMMIQHQTNLCLNSIQMTLLERPSCYSLEIMGIG